MCKLINSGVQSNKPDAAERHQTLISSRAPAFVDVEAKSSKGEDWPHDLIKPRPNMWACKQLATYAWHYACSIWQHGIPLHLWQNIDQSLVIVARYCAFGQFMNTNSRWLLHRISQKKHVWNKINNHTFLMNVMCFVNIKNWGADNEEGGEGMYPSIT